MFQIHHLGILTLFPQPHTNKDYKSIIVNKIHSNSHFTWQFQTHHILVLQRLGCCLTLGFGNGDSESDLGNSRSY